MKPVQRLQDRFRLVPVLAWFAIALLLRLSRLTALPPWTDECATIAFSLGNSFLTVPLDTLIDGDRLLEPLHWHATTTPADTLRHLMAESTHPPLYFWLSHVWLDGWLSWLGSERVLWAARSLSALLGALSVPALYAWAKQAFDSRRVAQTAAALMALSPFGIFLAQEARHYTLAILLAIASLSCFTAAVRAVADSRLLPRRWLCAWILANGTGIAVHYFFGLVPLAQGLVLVGRWWGDRSSPAWRGVGWAALGTAVTGLAWAPVWQGFADSDLTDWVSDGGVAADALLRAIAWLLSMLAMVPLDVLALPVWLVAANGLLLLAAAAAWWRVAWSSSGRSGLKLMGNWLDKFKDLISKKEEFRARIASIKVKLNSPKNGLVCVTKSAVFQYVIILLVLYLTATYLFGKDLTLAARFFFPVFPAFLVLAGDRLTQYLQKSPRTALFLILIAVIGSISIIFNLGYLQNHRGDRLADFIAETSDVPVVIATTHKHHGQTGRLQAIAWELNRLNFPHNRQFLLARKARETNPTQTVERAIAPLPRPFDLWTVEFRAAEISDDLNCDEADEDDFPDVNGYRYDLFRCR